MTLRQDWEFRGLVYQATDPALLDYLGAGGRTAYIGFDPTASSLHLGSLLQLCNLRRLQEAGNRPIALAGGGTGLIGDPSFKDSERPLLGPDELAANLEGIRAQLERFLDFSAGAGDARAVMADNAEWLTTIPVTEFLRQVGKHFTVNQMVAKESVRSRLDRDDSGLSFTEFSYMLIQAYDFLHLFDAEGCRLQIGGSDQWGNITTGVELIRRARGETAYALTTPLVTRADGTKLGKSEKGAVFLDAAKTSPYAFYQFFYRAEDSVVGSYLRWFSFLDHEEIQALDEATVARPQERSAQRALARSVTALVHGEEEVRRVERAAEALYGEGGAELDEATLRTVAADAPVSVRPRSDLDGGLDLAAALASCGLSPSRSAARTAIAQGGAYVNGHRVPPDGARLTRDDLIGGRYVLLRRGRREVHLLDFA